LGCVEKAKQSHPDLIKKSEELTADRGYDSTENNQKLFDDYFIKPIIDNRLMWKKGDADKGDLKQRNLYPDLADNIVYDEKGNVSCVCPGVKEDEYRQMAFCGFEKTRKSLKYRCPAMAYGFECSYRLQCGNTTSDYGRIVRVPLELDRRIFTPIARSSYAWAAKYNYRSAVERVNSRLDVSFGFEQHTIRGMAKMKFKVGLALIVMLSMAVGHIKAGREEMMRSLVKAA